MAVPKAKMLLDRSHSGEGITESVFSENNAMGAPPVSSGGNWDEGFSSSGLISGSSSEDLMLVGQPNPVASDSRALIGRLKEEVDRLK